MPIKTQLKHIFDRFGYSVKRKQYNSGLLRDFWSDWFARMPQALTESYIINRDNLSKVKNWIEEKDHTNSYWGYGIPYRFLNGKSKFPINYNSTRFTYSDLMLAIGNKMEKVNYLEIGVSAGKNFYQILAGVKNARIIGMDIEAINPVLLNCLSSKEKIWESGPFDFVDGWNRKVQKNYSFAEYQYTDNGNAVFYLSGDKFNPIVWDVIKNEKFNMIFSDAFHKPDSIKNEYEFLVKNDMIDKENFFMVWDDMYGKHMHETFESICKSLTKKYFKAAGSSFGVLDIDGTYGGTHQIGIFSSFKDPKLKHLMPS